MRSKRKDEHVLYALKQEIKTNDFDLVRLFHHSLIDHDIDEISLETKMFGHHFPYPFYINAMTGGSQNTKIINEKLATLASHFNLAMVVGSQHAALKDNSLIETYDIVRKKNENGFMIANVSFNASLNEALNAIDMIKANALSIHLNPIQELAMHEGDRRFKHAKAHIKDMVASLPVPVIVKEVGFGMSDETIKELIDLGVKYIDVSGMGGTNFAKIENERIKREDQFLESFGFSTVESLILSQKYQKEVQIIASGGIRNAFDIVKSLVLGADFVGMSQFFLKLIQKDWETQVLCVNNLIEDIKKIMLLLNVKTINELKKVKYQFRK